MDEIVNCPECSMDISANVTICPHCGFPMCEAKTETKNSTCPECGNVINSNAQKCDTCGYPLKPTINNSTSKLVDPKKKIIGIAMIAVGIIFAFLSYKTRFMGDYDYNAGVIERYEDNIKEYKDLKQEMLDEANSYSSGLFKTSYKNLANSYQDLIDDAQDSIDEYQGKQRAIVTKAMIMLLISVGLAGMGGYFIKKNSGGIA